MAATGISVADEVVSQFNEIKLQRIKVKYVVYKIENGSIVTERVSESAEPTFEEFLALLPPNECRYAIYDMNFSTNDGRPGNKLVMVSWAPDSSSVKSKMIYAGSKDALSRALVGVSVKVTATDMSELTEEILVEACRKFA